MNVLVWIILGALAGWIASMLISDSRRQRTVRVIFAGIIGAVIGGAIIQMTNEAQFDSLNIPSLIIAIIGSVGLIVIVAGFHGLEN